MNTTIFFCFYLLKLPQVIIKQRLVSNNLDGWFFDNFSLQFRFYYLFFDFYLFIIVLSFYYLFFDLFFDFYLFVIVLLFYYLLFDFYKNRKVKSTVSYVFSKNFSYSNSCILIGFSNILANLETEGK